MAKKEVEAVDVEEYHEKGFKAWYTPEYKEKAKKGTHYGERRSGNKYAFQISTDNRDLGKNIRILLEAEEDNKVAEVMIDEEKNG